MGRSERCASVRFGAIVIGPIRLQDRRGDGSPDGLARAEKCRRAFARTAAHRDQRERLDGRRHPDQIAQGALELKAPAGMHLRLDRFALVKQGHGQEVKKVGSLPRLAELLARSDSVPGYRDALIELATERVRDAQQAWPPTGR